MKETADLPQAFNLEQIQILKLIASGAPLTEVLERIVLLIESHSSGICSILLVDPETKTVRNGASPHLPKSFSDAIENSKIGPEEGSCGTSAYLGERVIVPDIATHPYWKNYRHLALPVGLKACWSSPIFSPTHEVLGTFAVYYNEPRSPEQRELDSVDSATHLASIAIMKERNDYELRNSEHLRSLIFNSVNDILFYLCTEPNDQFRFLAANESFFKTTGLKREQVIGQLVDNVIPEPSLTLVREKYRQAIRDRMTVKWDEVSEYPMGVKYGEVSAIPLFDRDGNSTGLVGVVRDMTERKKIDEQISTAQRMESLGTLAGGIAHDFNNMLTAIVGNISLAQRYIPDGHQAQKNLEIAHAACDRAEELIQQILSFSKSEDKKIVLNLQTVAEEAQQFLRSSTPAMIEIESSYAENLPAVFADPAQMQQIFMNVGTNAIRAMGDHGKLKMNLDTVTLSAPLATETLVLKPGLYVHLTISDTGSGMDRTTLHKIFEPFFSTRLQGQGTGLGLFVVHKIVKDHLGGILVSSKVGEGSKFEFYFPSKEGVSASEEIPATPVEFVPDGKRVMFVDDESSILAFVKPLLEIMGYQVACFTDPLQALEEFIRNPSGFDVVVTDFSTPHISGLELIKKIQQINPSVPTLLMSGYLRPEDAQAAKALNVEEILQKPNLISDLAKVLARVLAKNKTEEDSPDAKN